MNTKIDSLTLKTLGEYIANGAVEPLEYNQEQQEIIAHAQLPQSEKEKIAYEREWEKLQAKARKQKEAEHRNTILIRNIRRLRVHRGLLQKQMAKALGMQRQVYSQYERGCMPLRERHLPRIAKKLCVTVSDLLKEG